MEPVSSILTEVGQAYVHSWFDPVKMAKGLTGIHEKSGFSGLKELFSACCQWLSDVNRSPTGIFDVTDTVAFLDTENVDFDVLMPYF